MASKAKKKSAEKKPTLRNHWNHHYYPHLPLHLAFSLLCLMFLHWPSICLPQS